MGPAQFIASLRKGKPGPAYFLRGPDRFLHEECRAAIVASLPTEAREWCLMEIEYQPGRLARALDGAGQMPMLGGRSFLIFSDLDDFKHAPDEDYEALADYLERPSPFATLVFMAAEPDRRRRFTQLLEKKMQVVEMLPLGPPEAARWLKGYLERAGVEIDSGLAEAVVAKFVSTPDSPGEGRQTGVNLLWLRTEMEKLLTAKSGAKRLERADLDLVVGFREEHEISRLLGALADRQFSEALIHLRALLASKEPETLLLWSIGDLFRQALKAGSQPPPGRGAGHYGPGWAGGGRYSGPFSTQEIALRALDHYSRQELAQALRFVRAADLGIKSSWKDSRILLEFLLWQVVTGKESEALGESFERVLPQPADG